MNILTAAFCVLLFSLTVPFTRMAVLEIPAEAIIFLRLFGAAVVCVIYALWDGWLPPRKAWSGIAATAAGSVIGFSSLTAFALREVPSGHAAVALAAMPMATAAYAAFRDKARPGQRFWFFALTGTALSFSFFFSLNVNKLVFGDLLLILAVFAAAFGYVEGGRSSRIFGGARIMSWAVILTLPVMIPLAVYSYHHSPLQFEQLSSSAWISAGYLAVISQSLGMFLWFKVLARGPMEKIALVQLLQPFLTLLASILMLKESVLPETWLIAVLVGLCIFGANKERSAQLRKVSPLVPGLGSEPAVE